MLRRRLLDDIVQVVVLSSVEKGRITTSSMLLMSLDCSPVMAATALIASDLLTPTLSSFAGSVA